MELKLVNGAPEGEGQRLARELSVYEFLARLGIAFERLDHEAICTMEAGAAVNAALAPAVVCKNLLLTNRKKTEFFLLMLRCDKRFNSKEVAHQIGVPQLSFAPEEFMLEFLDILPGAVSVMGLMNDRGNRVKLLIDCDVLKCDLLGCHPCVNTSSIRLKMQDLLEKFLPAVGHDFRSVNV